MMTRFAYLKELEEIEAEMRIPELSDTLANKPCTECARYVRWQDGVR